MHVVAELPEKGGVKTVDIIRRQTRLADEMIRLPSLPLFCFNGKKDTTTNDDALSQKIDSTAQDASLLKLYC